MQLTSIDIMIIAAYAAGIVSLATWVSRDAQGHQKNTQDYFLAGKALPWWAIGAALGSAILSFIFKLLWPALPFIDRVGLVFLLCIIVAVGVSIVFPIRHPDHGNAVDHNDINFSTTSGFNGAAIGVILILTALYATWW